MNALGKYAGLIAFITLLFMHLAVMDRYGFTWDFHFHFFGGGKLLGIEPADLEPRDLPFVEPDPRRAWTLPYGPLMSIPPVASYLFFHKTLGLLAQDSAYHVPVILWGMIGIAATYAFMTEAFSRRTGIIAALFIALTPRFFGDMHNNMKDVPSAAVFAVNIWLLWRLVTKKRTVDILLAVAGFAVAFNVKVNSIFIPAVLVCWLLWRMLAQKIRTVPVKPVVSYLLGAPAAAFLLWWAFWPDPIGQLKHAFLTFGVGTNNIEVILNGAWYCSGSTVPWYYPYWYLAIVTPIPLLVLFAAGLGTRRDKSLLLLWLIVPLLRYTVPTIGVIDGVRHFEEVLFPIAAVAALGLDAIISRAYRRKRTSAVFVGLAYAAAFVPLAYAVATYHPYQITYFNELVGGVKGAMGNYDLDYWGTSQKEAVEWVNARAPENAKVHIVMAAAVAGQYLRPDLVPNLNKYGYDESDYVIFLNRQSFMYRFFYAYEYLLHHRPVYAVTVQGVPLTYVFDNDPANRTPRQTPYWSGEDPCIIKYWRGERP